MKGGAERVLVDIASGLAERSHAVAVISFDHPDGKSFYPLNKKVHRIPLGIGNVQRKATFPEVISRMIAIRKAAKKFQPHVVVAFMHSTFIPAAFALVGTGVPVVASEHIVPDHYKDRYWEYILLLMSRFFIKKITVLSDAIIQTYSPSLQKKMVPIVNPVHPAKKLADPVGSNDNKKVILHVGRLTQQKDQATLIKAFSLIEKEYLDWHLRIVGDGELEEDLRKLVEDQDLQGRVTFAGTTSDIESEYQKAHIFALSSRYESFGLATAEAMGHGLPVIGFADCPGTNELISHNVNGLLVEGEGRVEVFAQGLKKLMDEPNLRASLGADGAKKVDIYAPKNIVKEWEDVLVLESCKRA